jgi:probable rRNA maturation factor
MGMTPADKKFKLTQTTKDRVPALPFLSMKNVVLGKKYNLSLVIAGDIRSRSLNERYRGKTYVPNVLSFPLDQSNGEIFLNLKQAKREHRARGESYEYFVALLVIHGMLHLNGMAHGSTMEAQEQRLLRKFHIRNTFPL